MIKKHYISPAMSCHKTKCALDFAHCQISLPRTYSGAGQSPESLSGMGLDFNGPGLNNNGLGGGDEAGANMREFGASSGPWEAVW